MKKASYKRCFLYVIIIPKGDIMNTKYNIIITSITIILLIILKIINCKKYKNNQDSILLKNEKRNTKIFFATSIILFIFSFIFNKYINDYSLINNILSSLSIIFASLFGVSHLGWGFCIAYVFEFLFLLPFVVKNNYRYKS